MTPLELIVDSEITLKTWDIAAAPQLFALVDSNREHLSPWLPWVPFVKEVSDSEKFIRESLQNWKKESALELGIWYQEKLAGCLGLHALDRLHNHTSVGYWLGEKYEGNGIMTRSVQNLTQWCFENQHFNRVEIRAAVENIKSRAIPTRLGFVEEGILRQSELVQGKYLDILVFSILKQDWNKYGTTN
jgi:ribosomal-protein-serine acetyltransferase